MRDLIAEHMREIAISAREPSCRLPDAFSNAPIVDYSALEWDVHCRRQIGFVTWPNTNA